jgi:hypothetical protein
MAKIENRPARVLKCVDLLWGTDGFGAWKDGQKELYADPADSDAVAQTG